MDGLKKIGPENKLGCTDKLWEGELESQNNVLKVQ